MASRATLFVGPFLEFLERVGCSLPALAQAKPSRRLPSMHPQSFEAGAFGVIQMFRERCVAVAGARREGCCFSVLRFSFCFLVALWRAVLLTLYFLCLRLASSSTGRECGVVAAVP